MDDCLDALVGVFMHVTCKKKKSKRQVDADRFTVRSAWKYQVGQASLGQSEWILRSWVRVLLGIEECDHQEETCSLQHLLWEWLRDRATRLLLLLPRKEQREFTKLCELQAVDLLEEHGFIRCHLWLWIEDWSFTRVLGTPIQSKWTVLGLLLRVLRASQQLGTKLFVRVLRTTRLITTIAMAFESWRAPKKCYECNTEYKIFKLYESQRKRHKVTVLDQNDNEKTTFFHRVCEACELKIRLEEIKTWDNEKVAMFPSYATKGSVRMDMKRANKGSTWSKTAESISDACREVTEENQQAKEEQERRERTSAKGDDDADDIDNKWVEYETPTEIMINECQLLRSSAQTVHYDTEKLVLTKKNRKRKMLELAKVRGQTFANLIMTNGSGNLFEAMKDAGERMKECSEKWTAFKEYADTFWSKATKASTKSAFDVDTGGWEDDTAYATYENLEEALIAAQDYWVGRGMADPAVLTELRKALDFADQLAPGIRMFNVCKAKTGGWSERHGRAIECGLAFPAKLWWQKDVGSSRLKQGDSKWSYKCICEWEYLFMEHVLKPESEGAKWYEELVQAYGGDWRKFPRVGCESRFGPYASGPSVVVEMDQPNGETTAFMAERMPTVLDDEVKKMNLELTKRFMESADKCDPQKIYDLLPMSFPMSHNFVMPNGMVMKGIAKYPVADWQAAGEPYLTAVGWCKLCVRLTEGDLTNLHSIFESARNLLAERGGETSPTTRFNTWVSEASTKKVEGDVLAESSWPTVLPPWEDMSWKTTTLPDEKLILLNEYHSKLDKKQLAQMRNEETKDRLNIAMQTKYKWQDVKYGHWLCTQCNKQTILAMKQCAHCDALPEDWVMKYLRGYADPKKVFDPKDKEPDEEFEDTSAVTGVPGLQTESSEWWTKKTKEAVKRYKSAGYWFCPACNEKSYMTNTTNCKKCGASPPKWVKEETKYEDQTEQEAEGFVMVDNKPTTRRWNRDSTRSAAAASVEAADDAESKDPDVVDKMKKMKISTDEANTDENLEEVTEKVRLVPNYTGVESTVRLKSAEEVEADNDKKEDTEPTAKTLKDIDGRSRSSSRSRSVSSSKRYTNWKGTPSVTESVSLIPNPASSKAMLTPRERPLTNDLVDP